MRFHKLQNVQIALNYLKHRQVRGGLQGCRARGTPPGTPRAGVCSSPSLQPPRALASQVKLVNIRNDDIADGNPKLTLGLIWTIILHFQVSPEPGMALAPCPPWGSVGTRLCPCAVPRPGENVAMVGLRVLAVPGGWGSAETGGVPGAGLVPQVGQERGGGGAGASLVEPAVG